MRVDCSPHAEESRLGEILIGSSPLFRHIVAVADAVASNDCVVLLEGESGTGKELLARRIHYRSRRKDGPFIPVNCAGISETLFESQFFGHVKGAFTGAVSAMLGMVRAAQGGTLLLDEVGEIPMHLQPKLLRLLQEREVVPVGSSRPVSVDVRFVAATNRNLHKQVEDKNFRDDLYHRLNIVRIEIPPLRSRPDDIDELLEYYLDLFAQEYQMTRRELGPTVRGQIRQYSWPGNVRELCSYIERLYAANIPPMPPAMLDAAESSIHEAPLEAAPGRITHLEGALPTYSLTAMEQAAILKALKQTNWNRSAAAKLLDIHRSTLLRKMYQYGMLDHS
jgi:transcriptional regulator with PAS, ATPase and Fis domain